MRAMPLPLRLAAMPSSARPKPAARGGRQYRRARCARPLRAPSPASGGRRVAPSAEIVFPSQLDRACGDLLEQLRTERHEAGRIAEIERVGTARRVERVGDELDLA